MKPDLKYDMKILISISKKLLKLSAYLILEVYD